MKYCGYFLLLFHWYLVVYLLFIYINQLLVAETINRNPNTTIEEKTTNCLTKYHNQKHNIS